MPRVPGRQGVVSAFGLAGSRTRKVQGRILLARVGRLAGDGGSRVTQPSGGRPRLLVASAAGAVAAAVTLAVFGAGVGLSDRGLGRHDGDVGFYRGNVRSLLLACPSGADRAS